MFLICPRKGQSKWGKLRRTQLQVYRALAPWGLYGASTGPPSEMRLADPTAARHASVER